MSAAAQQQKHMQHTTMVMGTHTQSPAAGCVHKRYFQAMGMRHMLQSWALPTTTTMQTWCRSAAVFPSHPSPT